MPLLNAVIFDFSAVNGIDSTGLQTLVDVRREMERYSGHSILVYFAHVHPQFQRVLDYFLTNLRPNHDVAPVVANAVNPNPDADAIFRRVEADRVLKYGPGASYAQQFVFRTIDQAVEAAQMKLRKTSSNYSHTTV